MSCVFSSGMVDQPARSGSIRHLGIPEQHLFPDASRDWRRCASKLGDVEDPVGHCAKGKRGNHGLSHGFSTSMLLYPRVKRFWTRVFFRRIFRQFAFWIILLCGWVLIDDWWGSPVFVCFFVVILHNHFPWKMQTLVQTESSRCVRCEIIAIMVILW